MQTRTLKNRHNIHEMSVGRPMRQFFTPGEQTINGICMHCNILLNDNKSIPQTVFTNNNKMRTVWLLKTNSIPFMVDLVYILVQNSKFSLHILYINELSDSFPLLTIIKTNKTKTLFIVFSIEYIFLPQGD